MRHVTKVGLGTNALAVQHANPPTTAGDARARWDAFSGKAVLLQNWLLTEQYNLCCYSEARADELGIGYHIEHVENKSQAPTRTFDFLNLAGSAFDSNTGLKTASAQGWEVFGGHATGKRGVTGPVNMALFVSPHQPDCAKYFTYTSDGEVSPGPNLTPLEIDRADYTIRVLNLNSPFLVSLRRSWWDELDQHWQDHKARQWDLECLMSIDLLPCNGKLNRFFSLTRRFYQGAGDALLKAKAPQLL